MRELFQPGDLVARAWDGKIGRVVRLSKGTGVVLYIIEYSDGSPQDILFAKSVVEPVSTRLAGSSRVNHARV